MAKFLPDAEMDAAHDYTDLADLQVACSAYPTTYAEATATFKLADVAMTPNTDFAKANGDTSGRKITVAAKTSVSVDTAGTPTHVALVRTTDSTIRAVTECTGPALTVGSFVDFPAWDIEISDPT